MFSATACGGGGGGGGGGRDGGRTAFAPTRFGSAGVQSIAIPVGWNGSDGTPPLVAALRKDSATIAIWRYPREEQLPVTHDALVTAKNALVAEIVQRDPTFSLQTAKLLHVGPARAIAVIGTGAGMDGRRRSLRSTHVYANRAEYVIDASSDPTDFARLDQEVFQRVTDSLNLAVAAA